MRLSLIVACLWLATSPLWGKIVFYSKRDGNPQIYTMNSDGSNQTRLTFNKAGEGWATWSPNGQQIAFNSDRDGNWEIYVMDADGNNQRNLTHHPAFDVTPDWHPDGNRIAFMRGEDIAYLYTIDLDGDNLKLIAKAEYIADPKWSPDGERIAFEMFFENVFGENDGGIYVADADGKNLWRVSRQSGWSFIALGDWSPDGKKILYTEITETNAHGNPEDTLVIATLHRSNRKVIDFEEVKLPPSPLLRVKGHGWGADGKSILIAGKIGFKNIYRFRLDTQELIQLTDTHLADDNAPYEWNPRLSVPSQQGLLSQKWGELKAAGRLERRP